MYERSIGRDWAFEKMKSNVDIKLSAVCQSSQFTYRTVKEWNSLSSDVITSESLQIFKSKLSNYLRVDILT